MCGRYALTSPPAVIAARFNLLWVPEISAHYNIAPAQNIPVVRNTERGGELVLLKWGLIPSWARDASIGARLINARGETLADKPAFRNAYRHRHCLIPADAFYEWKAVDGRKQPYCIQLRDKALFAMAGLWEHWLAPDGQAVESCTIITVDANARVAELHARMPLIVAPQDYQAWLSSETTPALALPTSVPAAEMLYYPVSTRVNNARNDDPACLAPAL